MFVEHYHLKTRFDLMKGMDFIVGSNLAFEIPAHDQVTLSSEAVQGENPLNIMSAGEGLHERRRLNRSNSIVCAEESTDNLKLQLPILAHFLSPY